MKCPFCAHGESRVIDSRISKDGDAIRRRRECLGCIRRFTTYEYVEEVLPIVVKKDGRREPFDRAKIRAGIKKACEKRPISTDDIEALINRVERACQDFPDKEVPSSAIGEGIMRELQALDGVAYVRFASVYRQFRDVGDFVEELKDLLRTKKAGKRKKTIS
ncbi:MAG: transcriptional regulator NrdR [Thermodesulfobacteriota bacterium]